MKAHQKRVVEEKEELDAKLAALNGFLSKDMPEDMTDEEHGRLVNQASIMGQYSNILAERIASF